MVCDQEHLIPPTTTLTTTTSAFNDTNIRKVIENIIYEDLLGLSSAPESSNLSIQRGTKPLTGDLPILSPYQWPLDFENSSWVFKLSDCYMLPVGRRYHGNQICLLPPFEAGSVIARRATLMLKQLFYSPREISQDLTSLFLGQCFWQMRCVIYRNF